MLYVDKRVGSGELAKYLAMLHVPIEVTTLAFGDMSFLGRGEGECPVPIGIERKALTDFLSSMFSGRLPGHQLPGLLQSFQEIWIVLEGLWRVDAQSGMVLIPNGKGKTWAPLEVGGKGIMYRELEGMMLTLEIKGGVRFRRTGNKHETGKFIGALYHWWTDKSFAEHRAHLQFHTANADKALLVPPSLCREWANKLPGVAWVKSGAIDQFFESAEQMVLAPESEWSKIDGIGKPMAKKIVEAIKRKRGGTK